MRLYAPRKDGTAKPSRCDCATSPWRAGGEDGPELLPTPRLVLALRPPAPNAGPLPLLPPGTPGPLTPAMAPTSPRRSRKDAWAEVMLDMGLVAKAGTTEEKTPEGLELTTGPAEDREKDRRGRGAAESPRAMDPPGPPLPPPDPPGTGTTAAEVAGRVRDRPRLGRVAIARGDAVLGAAADATAKGSRRRGDRMAVTGRA